MEDTTLADLMLSATRAELAKVHTSIVATVLSYDHATQKATVQPAVKSKRIDGQTDAISDYEVGPIPNVPVCFPSGSAGAYNDTWPLAPGDSVLLIVVERSIDEWKTTGAASCDAQDVRRFDLSDAVAIPWDTSFARPVGATGRSATARVIEAPMLLLGSALATEGVLKGTTYEAHLLTWLTGATALLVGLATGIPATIAAAAATFQPIHATFLAQVAAGHTSAVTKTT